MTREIILPDGTSVEADFISFVDCPDVSEIIGSDTEDKLFMGIS